MTSQAPLLGELHAAGFRPYLELEMGESDDSLRVFCELDNETLLDISIGDEGIPDVPVAVPESDWVVFVQSASGRLSRRGVYRGRGRFR